jgi:hypothetical protein
LGAILSVAAASAIAVATELTVHTDFEGASATVVAIDQGQRCIRFEPGGDPRDGWPCWWNLCVRGARPGETLTLQIRASSTPIPQSTYTWLKDKPLSLDWAAPDRAAWSVDDDTWQRTEPGTREEEWMTYRLKAESDRLYVAWGPPYTPSRAGKFARECEKKYPVLAKAESLCRSREGRPVALLRIIEGLGVVSGRNVIWVQARQHAWESGSSWVAQGFAHWLLVGGAEADWLRQHHEIVVVPIMDVDHVAKGQGGKEAMPQDHNRDWTDRPHWPEVNAAQVALSAWIEAGCLSAFIDLHNPGPNALAVHFHVPPDERAKPGQSAAIDRFNLVARTNLSRVMPVQENVLKSGGDYDPTWMRMSHNWVAARASESTLALCIETPWNSDQSSQEGYQRMGAAIGLTLYHHLHDAHTASADK